MRTPSFPAIAGSGRQLLAGVLVPASLLATACTTATPLPPDGVTTARSLAIACVSGTTLTDELGCPATASPRALVGGGSRGTISVANPASPDWFDLDSQVPGLTPLRTPGLPGPIVIDAAGKQAFATIVVERQIVRLDLSLLAGGALKLLDALPLGFDPAGIVLVTTPPDAAGKSSRRLYIADPAGQKVWWVDAASFGPGAQLTAIAVPGSPATLAWSAAANQLFVGHLRHAYLSVLGLDGTAPVAPIAIARACADGLDDDGDGKIDRDDPGCDAADDPSEADPELGALCGNGSDDDADGQTDAADLGCTATATTSLWVADACRNGVDDDGDGQTDYPADSGCTGHADASEWSDAATCADGLDNDGDGQTDLADPTCGQVPEAQEVSPVVDGDPGAVSQPAACADGVDDDGDGLVDLADPDCWDRASPTEAGPDRAPATLLATTFDGRYVVAADRSARVLLVVDAKTHQLITPQPGKTAPFLRASQLDAREGLLGLATGSLPTALGPVLLDGATDAQDKIAMAVGLSGAGVGFLQLDVGTTQAIGLVPGSTTEQPTVVDKPGLLLAGVAVDLGSVVPARYASLGPLRKEALPDGRTRFYGVTPTTAKLEHRSEVWRLTFEGVLPGGERSTGRLLRKDRLHDPLADFCRMGVLPGDLLLLHRGGTQTCSGQAAGTVQYRVAEVRGDTLDLVPDSGKLDQPVADADLLKFTPKPAQPQPMPDPACYADGLVRYTIRAQGWLVTGSRTGLLSTRPTRDGVCAPLTTAEQSGARLLEPALATGAKLPTCPYDPAKTEGQFVFQPFQHPVFEARMYPGCRTVAATGGGQAVELLPSIRDAQWLLPLSSGFAPLVSPVGVSPAAIKSGPNVKRMYVVDEGVDALHMVELPTGRVLTSLQ